MSDYGICRFCGEHAWLRLHTCPPDWDVLCPDWNGDDPYTVRARNAEDAATEWCDRYDEERQLSDGSGIDVLVRKSETDDPWRKFHVYGETVVNYHADERPN